MFWRMQLAKQQLTKTALPIALIAERTGDGSETSFSKTFRKVVGMAPGRYRRRAEGAAGDATEHSYGRCAKSPPPPGGGGLRHWVSSRQ